MSMCLVIRTDMRKTVIFVLAAAALIACRENHIELYSEAPRIEFGEDVYLMFDDRDYLDAWISGTTAAMDTSFRAQLIGNLLESPIGYCVRTEPAAESSFDLSVTFSQPYSFPVGETVVSSPISVSCPGKEYASTRNMPVYGIVDILYDETAPEHGFGQGRVENLVCRLSVTLQVYPQSWDSATWGAYSTAKYFLMMETFRAVHDDISKTVDNQLKIRAAYNAFKKENGPLYGDDEDSGTEIAFPIKQ